MDKLNMKTKNIADENYAALAKLFPNALTETITGYDENGNAIVERAIDADVLRQEISCKVVEGKDERYQFTWPDKKKSILLANAPISATLRPCREESVDFDNTENVYIEGDNLDVLKLLKETYLGKIKMIYIDPPYNTGNDLVYNDDFSAAATDYIDRSGQLDFFGNRLVQNTESNGRFHTDWLNMIYPRLKVAKDLLCEEGLIFVSLDENEIENFKKVCNEIFGEQCLVATLHVEMSATQGMKVKAAQNGNIVKNAEYVLIYSKNGRKNIAETILYDYRPEYDEHYSKFLKTDNTLVSLKEEFTSVYPTEKITTLAEMYRCSEVFRKFVEENTERIFADDKITGFDIADFTPHKVYKVIRDEKEYFVINNGTKMRQLLMLKNSFGQCDDFENSFGLRKIRGDWWKEFYKDMGNVSKEGSMVFANGKKPLRLIKQLCKMCTKDDIILDFFSGSATTAHAIMKLNEEDGGKRKFIMVQLPEKPDKKSEAYKEGFETICEVGKERIRRAGDKIQKGDIGFRVLKLDTSNMKDVYYNPSEIQQHSLFESTDNIKEDRTPEDLLFQVMLDLGVLLSSKIEETEVAGKKIFNVADNFLVACFDNDITEETVKAVAQMEPYYAVFRDSCMANDSVATNFDQIFATYSPSTVRKVL